MEIPEVWLWISGIFFVCGLLMYLVLVFVLIAMWRTVRSLKPKLDKITTSLSEMSTRANETTRSLTETTGDILTKTRDAVEKYAMPVGIATSIIAVLGALGKARAQIKKARET